MPKKNEKFIIDVVPLTRIPLTRNQSFWYLSPEELLPGTLVSTPLFRRKVEGVVLDSKPDFERLGNIELKGIDQVISPNFLDKKQLELARFISDYYLSPLGIVLKSFVPKRTKMRSKKNGPYNSEQKSIVLTKDQQKAIDHISDSKFEIRNSKFLLHGPSGSGKTEVYIHSILKLKEKDKNLQFLVLVPEQTLTPQAIERYGAYFPAEEMAVMSSNVSKGQYFDNWQRIKSGEAKIIIGTRMAVFAPFKKLGLVVIDEEQDMSYKNWDMNPRYDARRVAEKLSEIHKCPIVRGSATPLVESYYKTENQEYRLVSLPQLKLNGALGKLPETLVVDMKLERWKNLPHRQAGNLGCISKELKGEIAYVLKNKLQTVLFINRQGMSSFSVCTKCKEVLKCPECSRALVLSNTGYYRCLHCSYKTSVVPECPKCRNIAFKNVGLGTQKVEKEINNLFPGARVLRMDSEAIRSSGYQEKVYEEFSRGEADILIGTQMISKGWDLPKVALVGIIDADNMLSLPDYFASEKAFGTIVQIAGRTGRPGAKYLGRVVIQTFQSEDKIIQRSAARDFKGFYAGALEERKGLHLPPFGNLIKLIYQDYSKEKAEKETRETYKKLEEISPKVSLSEPQDAFVSRVRGRYRKQIMIRLEDESRPKKLTEILQSLPAEWIIDVDPISIV